MNEEYIFGNTGVTNTSIGIDTLANITSGIDNTAFGTNALRYVTDGDGNSAFGINSISDPSGNPSFSTAFGTQALTSVTTGLNNSAFGYQALTNITTGSENIGFGNLTGATLTTGARNLLIGSNADTNGTNINDSVGIGSSDVGIGGNVVAKSEDILIGPANRGGGENIKIGSDSNRDESSFWMVAMGYHAGSTNQFLGRFSDVVIGHEAMADPDPDYFPSYSESTCIGKRSGLNCEESFSDTIIGYEANQYTAFSQLCVVVGTRANQIPLTPNAFSPSVVIVGYEAGINSINNNDNISFPCIVGAFAGQAVVEEGRMTICGYEASKNAKGSNNTAIGYRAMLGTAMTNETDASPGTSVDGGTIKFTSLATTSQGNQFVGDIVAIDATGATTAGLDGTYFLISSLVRDYYVWFNVDGVSVDPAVAAHTSIAVNLISGDSVSSILSKLKSALNNNVYNDFEANTGTSVGIVDFAIDTGTISGGTAVGTLQLAYVTEVAPASGIGRVDVGGAIAEALSKNYFLFSSGAIPYYAWFNRDGYDTDPGPGGLNIPALVGKTGIQVNVSDSASNSYVIAQNIQSALSGFGSTYPSNFMRIVMNRGPDNNVAVGNNALSNVTLATQNVVIGSDAGMTMEDARDNVIIGRNADANAGNLSATVLGSGASTSADYTTVLGMGASATASKAIAIGSGATATTADGVQFGPNAISGTATMSFRSQIVCDESWIGGGESALTIDNNGNLVRTSTSSFTTTTTDATPTILGSPPDLGPPATWTIPVNGARKVQALITGRRTAGGGAVNDSGVYRLEAAVKNNGGTLTVFSVKEVEQEDVAGWNVALAEPAVPDGTVQLYVTGAAATTIMWEAKIKTFTIP